MSRRLVFLLALIALVAAACTSEGLPNSYADQDGRAERQFVAACEASLADTDEPNAPEFCQCAFYTVASDLSFDEFLALDKRLKDDPEFLSAEERSLLENVSLPCAFTADDIRVAAAG